MLFMLPVVSVCNYKKEAWDNRGLSVQKSDTIVYKLAMAEQ